MSKLTESRTVTLRLPKDLYAQASDLARRRNKSLNALLQEGTQRMLQDEEDRALSEAFELLSQHPDECDVEYAIGAQAEVMLKNAP